MSTSGLTNQYDPPTLDGLTILDADAIYINGQEVNLDALVPYTGATQAVDLGAFPLRTSYSALSGSDVVNKDRLDLSINNVVNSVGANFLSKTDTTDQTVSSKVTFLKEFVVSPQKRVDLAQQVVVDANYQNLITSASVSVSQHFGTITNSLGVYQSTCTNNAIPALLFFSIINGQRYRFTVDTLISDATYDWTVDFYQSQDGINAFPNFNEGLVDTKNFAPSSSLFQSTDSTFQATTTGWVVATITTTNPSGIGTLQWKDLTVYDMGVELENITTPSLTADRVVVINDKKQLVSSGINTTKLGYLDNVSSDIQTQLNSKLSNTNGQSFGTMEMTSSAPILFSGFTGSKALITNGSKQLTESTVTSTELGYVSGVTSSIQTQLDGKASSSAFANYLPLTGGTLTGYLTVSPGNTVSLADGLTINTVSNGTAANLTGYAAVGVIACTVTALSPPPAYQVSYSGGLNGGLQVSGFSPDPTRSYLATFTKVYRQPGLSLLSMEWIQDNSLVVAPLVFVTANTYAAATTVSFVITPITTGTIFLSIRSNSAATTNWYFDSFTLTTIEDSITAPLSLSHDVVQNVGRTSNLSNGVRVAQVDQGYTGASFQTTSPPTGVQGGTITGPVSGYRRLTAPSGQAEMSMNLTGFSFTAGETYTYQFRNISGSVPLTLRVLQATSIGIISTNPVSNSVGLIGSVVRGSFVCANTGGTIAFVFQAASANPYTEWLDFRLTRADTQATGTLTVGRNALVSGNVGIGMTSPNAPLQFANTTVSRKIVLWEAANNDHQFYGFGINPSTLRYQVDSSGANHVFFSGASSTTSSELMRITGTGRVGIGTTSPSVLLHVGGPAVAGDVSRTEMFRGSRNATGGVQNAVSMALSLGPNVSTINPFGVLDIKTNGTPVAGNDFGRVPDVTVMSIIGNGRVGIGYTAPSNALEVLGDTRSSGSFIVNNVGDCRFYNGTTDAYTPGSRANNLLIKSWWGIGFESYDSIVRINFNTRDGSSYFGSNMSIGGTGDTAGRLNITNPNASRSHFGYSNNWNYIRGANTQIDTPITTNSTLSCDGAITGSEIYTNNWMRINANNGGLYWQNLGRGLTSPEQQGNTYGNVCTYNTGRNGWSGYGIFSYKCFMGDVNGNSGIYDNTYGWFIYMPNQYRYERNVNLAGCFRAAQGYDRLLAFANGNDTGGGYMYYNQNNVLGTASDERIKKDFKPISEDKSIVFIKGINPTSFCLKNEEKDVEIGKDKDGKPIYQRCSVCSCRQDGFIAQDVLSSCEKSGVAKSVISNWSDYQNQIGLPEEERTAILGVSDRPILAHCVNVIKNLLGRVDTLEAREAIWLEDAKQKEREFADYRTKTEERLNKLALLVQQLSLK